MRRDQSTELPLQYWSSEDIRDHISLSVAVRAIREACLSTKRVDQPPRMSLGDGRLLVMAARSDEDGTAVVKVVGVEAHGGTAGSHPSVQGVVLGMSGSHIRLADADALTLLRTAAMVSLATDLLAPPDAHSLAVLGAGRQGREQASAAALVREVREISIWNRTPARAEALAAELTGTMPGVRIRVSGTAEDALSNADIVCCATAATEPLFDMAALRPEVHVNAIGSYRPDMHELPAALLSQASIVAVDDVAACQAESGEVIAAIRDGLDARTLWSLPDLLATPPERSGRTVFKSVGMAIADLAVANLLAQVPTPGSSEVVV